MTIPQIQFLPDLVLFINKEVNISHTWPPTGDKCLPLYELPASVTVLFRSFLVFLAINSHLSYLCPVLKLKLNFCSFRKKLVIYKEVEA